MFDKNSKYRQSVNSHFGAYDQKKPGWNHDHRFCWTDLSVFLASLQIHKGLMFLAAQEVNVTFIKDALVGCPTIQVARAEPDESERNPTKSKSFFSTERISRSNGRIAAPKIALAASEAPSLKSRAQFSSKYHIYSAKVTVSAKSSLEKGLESATKKKPPKDFPFEMVFVSRYVLILNVVLYPLCAVQ